MAHFSYSRQIADGTADFDRDEYRHFITVMRKKTGDQLDFLDGLGGIYKGKISSIDSVSHTFTAEITNHHHCLPKTPSITLALALPKGKKFVFIIQKAVEMGITEIIPLESRYTVTQVMGNRNRERKYSQWQKTALEAIKQCGNPYLPEVTYPVPLQSLVLPAEKDCIKLLFHGQAENGISTQAADLAHADKIVVIIGPEGGFSPEEINFLTARGCRNISLGSSTLRLETATIAAIAIVQYLTASTAFE